MNFVICKLFWISSLVIGLCFTNTILADDRECIEREDCAKKGHSFCVEFKCTSCVPCQLLNRQPPGNSNDESQCAATAESCGSCLPGYQPETKPSLEFLSETNYICEKTPTTNFRIDIL